MLELFKSNKKTTRAKILLVDDEPDVLSTVEYHIKSCEYEIITAGSGEEGLEKAQSEKPDLILLDVKMPIMDGYKMLKRIRNHPDIDIKDTPVIMLTACSELSDITIAADLGIADYVTKPFDFTELRDKITNALENKNGDNI
jgi:two-component system alkaline phosphatase synthesis response regulator PhoP